MTVSEVQKVVIFCLGWLWLMTSCFSIHAPYQTLLMSQSIGSFANILQGKFLNTSSTAGWQWRNFTTDLGPGLAGITVSTNYDFLTMGMMSQSAVLHSDGRSFTILADNLTRCHYVLLFPEQKSMLYTDAGEHIYHVDLDQQRQTVLLDNVGGSAGTRGLIYDKVNNWIYFSGVQLMRSRPDGSQLQNITRFLNLTSANPGFQITLDDFPDPENPRIYLAFDGGLYMAQADGSHEKRLLSTPTDTNFTGPYGVAIGTDPFHGQKYIYWCRGRRGKEAFLERSLLSSDGELTNIELLWHESSASQGRWLYALALVPWSF